MIDPKQLAAEFTNDPVKIGYGKAWSAGADNVLLDLVNAPRFSVPAPVPRALMLQWAAKYNVLGALRDHAANPASPVRSVADGALLMLTLPDANLNQIDMTDPDVIAMFDALSSAGVVSAESRAAFPSLSKLASRAEQLWGTACTQADIARART